jgi:glycosyltransferase involved in cell wall biosynthesis
MYKDLVSDKPIPDPTDASRKLRVAVVTETYPPEVNGVARTLARMVEGLHSRGHDVQLVRPQQPEPAIEHRPRFEQLMVRSMPIPFYPQLRMGLASKGSLQRLWRLRRPDIVHVATEGPLGWTALAAAQGLGLPVSSDFRTNFHAYTQHYGMAWLHRPMAATCAGFTTARLAPWCLPSVCARSWQPAVLSAWRWSRAVWTQSCSIRLPAALSCAPVGACSPRIW